MSDREGDIIDTESEPGAYADALRFPPWIEDGDGVAFNQAFQNARGGLANRDALAAPLLNVPFHNLGDSDV